MCIAVPMRIVEAEGLSAVARREGAPDLKVDTHGAAVKPDVWQLLAEAYRVHGIRPTLLERDFNFPPLAELLREVDAIRALQGKAPARAAAAAHG